MAPSVSHPDPSVTQATHPFTYDCHFIVPETEHPELINVEGFRNLLEAHIGTLNRAKQVSYTRNAAWLRAIRDKNTTPPKGYVGNRASWKNEIGATNPATSKWVVENGQVYKKDRKAENGREEAHMTATEGLYDLMIFVHAMNGHKGRDNFYNLVKAVSGSVKKAFCHQFVQVCCEKAESWQDGHVAYGWQAPVKRRDGGENAGVAVAGNINAADNADIAVDMNAAVDVDPPVSPQSIQHDGQQFDDMGMDFGDFNFNDLDPPIMAPDFNTGFEDSGFEEFKQQMLAMDWNMDEQPTLNNHPAPPNSQVPWLQLNTASYFPAPPTPPAGQNLIDAEFAAFSLQELANFENPPPT